MGAMRLVLCVFSLLFLACLAADECIYHGADGSVIDLSPLRHAKDFKFFTEEEGKEATDIYFAVCRTATACPPGVAACSKTGEARMSLGMLQAMEWVEDDNSNSISLAYKDGGSICSSNEFHTSQFLVHFVCDPDVHAKMYGVGVGCHTNQATIRTRFACPVAASSISYVNEEASGDTVLELLSIVVILSSFAAVMTLSILVGIILLVWKYCTCTLVMEPSTKWVPLN